MAITTRSVETLCLESIQAIFLADADVVADFVGGVHVGPLTPDAQHGTATIVPRQINLMLAPSGLFVPGVSGVTDATIGIVIAVYDHFTHESVATGSPNVNPWDRLSYLQTLMLDGSDRDGSGKFVNPDDPDSQFPTTRILNTTIPEFRTVAMGIPVHVSEKQKTVARVYAMLATFEARMDNATKRRR